MKKACVSILTFWIPGIHFEVTTISCQFTIRLLFNVITNQISNASFPIKWNWLLNITESNWMFKNSWCQSILISFNTIKGKIVTLNWISHISYITKFWINGKMSIGKRQGTGASQIINNLLSNFKLGERFYWNVQ